MTALLHVLTRLVHLLGMVVLVGGAAAVWYSLRTVSEHAKPLVLAYEWLFWGVLGAMIVTGVGNLGALGAPSPATHWGTLLTVKLVVVLGLVVGSLPRTLLVSRQQAQDGDKGRIARRTKLRRFYALTTLALVVIVTLAEVLAHG